MKCIENIAASIGLNCTNPLQGGYTGRAVFIPSRFLDEFSIQHNAQHPTKVAINPDEVAAHCVAIDNLGMTNPFDGSVSAGNEDSGFRKMTKSLSIRIPMRGGLASEQVIDPLLHGEGGIVIAEKRDTNPDGAFEIIGLESPARVIDPSTVTRNEDENGGAWLATLQCSEFRSEYVLVGSETTDTTYAAALTAFEAILAKAY